MKDYSEEKSPCEWTPDTITQLLESFCSEDLDNTQRETLQDIGKSLGDSLEEYHRRQVSLKALGLEGFDWFLINTFSTDMGGDPQ